MKLPTLAELLPGALEALSTTNIAEPLQNANHIFNAIHDSMRQFGSSLHHNGMSFFLASVPEGIHLYHGNARPDHLKEIGWKAFEPEHAMSEFEESAGSRIIRVLASFDSPDAEESISLCATQFLSAPDANTTLAGRAIYAISHRICSTLVNLRGESDDRVVHAAVGQLVEYLDWTVWKEFRGCRDEEFCAVPISPQGSKEDFGHPRCRRFEEGWRGEGGYLGGFLALI
ncbi:uncharacterized protein BDV17DRAFT_292914 [Aspergillus undulatus]|uniref:uncharacterized protein n=1 Tax=Aspergillus undulatus TaxID=1810928 RepID=UPI003CCDC7C1